MMSPMSENGIFWNVYEQECRFRGVEVKQPRSVRATCDKLAAVYPDLDDAEMFMRSQFVTKIEDIDCYFPDLVFAFKDFIMPRHRQAYEEYKRWQVRRVEDKLWLALNETETIGSGSRELRYSTSPLVWYLLEKDDCPWEYQADIAIECLHFPYLMDQLLLTNDLKERIQFYKDEVRDTVSRGRYSGNPKYQPIDLSDL